LDENNPVYHNKGNFCFISLNDWIKDERKITSLADELINALTVYSRKSKQLMILVFCPPPKTTEYEQQIQELECNIKKQFENTSNIYICTHKELFSAYPVTEYFDEYLYHQGGIPYTEELYMAMAAFATRLFDCTQRTPKKVVVIDCDNTLWQGVVGEDGVNGVQIKLIHSQLQKKMKDLRKQGFLLALCSKNTLIDVKNVFDNRKDMILAWSDISSYQINWNTKSENIKNISKELNLAVDSFIFIDDNPIECLEIQQNYPGIKVIIFPTNKESIDDYLNSLWCFDLPKQTKEDSLRADFYAKNKERELIESEESNLESFISRLNVITEIHELNDFEIPRVSQLSMRTTQFNTSTKKLSEQEINNFIKKENAAIYTVNVSDKFGDYGLVGAMMIVYQNNSLIIEGLWLSCRALGRGVEKKMYEQLIELCLINKCNDLLFLFNRTDRNIPAELFLKSIGAEQNLEGYFVTL